LRRTRLELEFCAAGSKRLDPALGALHRTEVWLQAPPRVAILGEFNSGKSSLANLLAGIEALPTSIVSNTCIPTLLRYAGDPIIEARYADGRTQRIDVDKPIDKRRLQRLDVGLPAPQLRRINLLDLPGLADPRHGGSPAVLGAHRPSAAIWCTVATQAWKESERVAWLAMPPRVRANSILAVTFKDLLTSPAEEARVLQRLREQAGPHFREIVLVATRAALEQPEEARFAGGETTAGVWQTSGGLTMIRALDRMVDVVERMRIDRARKVTAAIAGRALDLLAR
jgi:energy-coupling factor transporter ATP-binding protein EcfA2